MATSQYPEYPVAVPGRSPYFWSWGGIFSGTFIFAAIETTFGLLGAAIWSSASPGGGGVPTTPLTQTGFQVWMIVVSFIALYFAGRTASKLLYGNADRNLGMYHGLVTFGMCIFTTVLVVALATAGAAAATTTAHLGSPTTMASVAGEWWLFVTFVCSMVTAAIGGMHGVNTHEVATDRTVATKRVA